MWSGEGCGFPDDALWIRDAVGNDIDCGPSDIGVQRGGFFRGKDDGVRRLECLNAALTVLQMLASAFPILDPPNHRYFLFQQCSGSAGTEHGVGQNGVERCQ